MSEGIGFRKDSNFAGCQLAVFQGANEAPWSHAGRTEDASLISAAHHSTRTGDPTQSVRSLPPLNQNACAAILVFSNGPFFLAIQASGVLKKAGRSESWRTMLIN
jgi:hypothetical protein